MGTKETDKCIAGCMLFDGWEIKHHPDCVFYKKSLSRYYDELQQKTQQQQEIIKRLKSCIDKHIDMLETPANENGKSIGDICYSMKLETETILKETNKG